MQAVISCEGLALPSLLTPEAPPHFCSCLSPTSRPLTIVFWFSPSPATSQDPFRQMHPPRECSSASPSDLAVSRLLAEEVGSDRVRRQHDASVRAQVCSRSAFRRWPLCLATLVSYSTLLNLSFIVWDRDHQQWPTGKIQPTALFFIFVNKLLSETVNLFGSALSLQLLLHNSS